MERENAVERFWIYHETQDVEAEARHVRVGDMPDPDVVGVFCDEAERLMLDQSVIDWIRRYTQEEKNHATNG